MRHASIILALSLALVGCGGSDAPDDRADTTPTPEATATPKPIVTKALNAAQVDKIKPGTSQADVIDGIGADPVLVQRPTGDFPGGCIFYPIQEQRIANVWEFCFNGKGLNLLLTTYSTEQPLPPDGASQTRAALLARGDATCNSQGGYLSSITDDVTAALRVLGRDESKANMVALAKPVSRFVANIDKTHELLAAYEAPPDGADALQAYLDALDEQTSVLRDARDALLDGDMATYEELGGRFDELGKQAKASATEYGFSQCSASTFS